MPNYVAIALVTTLKNLLQGNTSSSVYNCNFSPWNRPPVVKMSPICFTSFFELRNNKLSSQFKAISVFFTREFLVSPKHLSRRFEFRVFFGFEGQQRSWSSLCVFFFLKCCSGCVSNSGYFIFDHLLSDAVHLRLLGYCATITKYEPSFLKFFFVALARH